MATALQTVKQQRRLSFHKDAPVYYQGDEAKHLYLVESGTISLCRLANNGNLLVFDRIGKGGLFGQESVLTDAHYMTNAAVMEAAVVLQLPPQDYAAAAFRAGQRRLNMLMDLIESKVNGGVGGTLCRLLACFAEGEWIHLTHQQVAEVIFSSRETVTRALNGLQEIGLVELQHRGIKVLNREGLIDMMTETRASVRGGKW